MLGVVMSGKGGGGSSTTIKVQTEKGLKVEK
jgi:hypothetical protein